MRMFKIEKGMAELAATIWMMGFAVFWATYVNMQTSKAFTLGYAVGTLLALAFVFLGVALGYAVEKKRRGDSRGAG